jgi:hypothetical protein
MMDRRRFVLTSLAGAVGAPFAAGCASIPLATSTDDAVAKTFSVPPGKASIYVVRDGGYMSGAWQLFRVRLDGLDHGALSDGTYFVFTVDPGIHGVVAGGNENQEAVRLEVAPNRAYFIAIRSHIGMSNARVGVTQLSDEEGRAAVMRARLAAAL